MQAYLIQIDAQTLAGSAQTIRLASHDDAALCHLDGAQWQPAIDRLPSLRYDFFGGNFNGSIARPQAQFSASINGAPLIVQSRFAGARFRLYAGELPKVAQGETLILNFIAQEYFSDDGGAADAVGGLSLLFDGIIDREPQIGGGIASFTAGPDDAWLDNPLLDTYAGSGGLEGPDALEGNVKPLILGNTRFAPGILIDATDDVYQVSAYGDIQAVNEVYDRVVKLGTVEGDYASLAALIAAALEPGEWATCLADGLVRLGAPADGTISFDVSGDNSGTGGYVRKPGAMIGRIAEIAGGTTNAANLSALDTDRPYNLALVLNSQVTARQAIQEIADSVGATVGIDWTGTLFVQALGYGTASETLKMDGSAAPAIVDVSEQPIGAPFWRLATNAEPTWVVHTIDEIGTGYNIRGEYSATRVYRIDDLVFASDGRAFAYINATPGAGNAPPALPATSNTYWTLVSSATTGATADEAAALARATRTYLDANEPYPIYLQVGDPTTDSPSLDLDFVSSFVDGDVWFTPESKLVARWDAASAAWDRSLADVTKTISGQAEIVLEYDSGGTITTTLPKSVAYSVAPAGGSALSSGVTWAASTRLQSGESASDYWSGTVPSISGTGQGVLAINSGLKVSMATVDLTATIDGTTYPAFAVSVVKNVAAATGGGGSSDFDSVSLGGQSVNSTSYAQIAALTVTTGASSTEVDLTASAIPISPASSPTGSVNIDMKWQYDSGGGTWVDVGSAAASDPDPNVINIPPDSIPYAIDGEITCNRTQTSLSSSTSYDFRLMAKNTTGTRTHYFGGTVSAQG